MREQEGSRRSGVQLAAAICASIRRGQRERNGKGEGWTSWLSAKAWDQPLGSSPSHRQIFGTTYSVSENQLVDPDGSSPALGVSDTHL